jgi:hypothetical protein
MISYRLPLVLLLALVATEGFLKAAGARDIDWVGVWISFNL